MLKQDVHAPAVRPVAVPRPRNLVPWLAGAVVVLAVAVLGLGAVIVQPMVTATPGEALVDRLIAAWNVSDEQEIRAVYTDDAIIWMSHSATPSATGIDEVADLARYGGVKVERIGPVSERGNLVWLLHHVTSDYDVSGSDAVLVLYLRDGKVAQQWVIWDELE
ncbi:MAG: hypothetical protein A2X23_08925 [Chloroflexi bacterium GWC2_73_18]|nr:MAG: hypothetical protein A2X23_08925 [Chloroflexi bacterium GWC2_73_18]